ncbi:MAG TPA: putative Ig domain-containing protein [bacterium]|nr:putative Ig domain-containing protein [bacterium]HOL35020.1 putative Ig domain-containing protein [bacterium]HPP08639.1 putative Ig domain-containing protein [bacterium]
MRGLRKPGFLFVSLIILSFVANAATVSGPVAISVRAGGPSSSTSVSYTASYGSGESGDFTWTETGILPGGAVTISRTGGSPFTTATLSVFATSSTSPGPYSVTVNAYPATGTAGSLSVTITVVEGLGSISPTTIPAGKENAPVNVQFAVSSGSGNYIWSVSGAPNGVSINSSTGLLSGTPQPGTAGSYTLTITVTDNTPPVVSTQVVIPWQVFPAYIPLIDAGQICYETAITRDTNGQITSTGDLYVKNLEKNTERRVTNYGTTGTGAILNPMFTPDGSKILYTYSPNPATTNFKVYLVSTQATVSDINQGLILRKNNQEAIPPTANVKYAVVSPNYNGSQGLLVFTWGKIDRTELWTYDFTTEALTQIKSEANLEIRHPVFLNSSVIAFLGIKNGMQDIYVINIDGSNYRKITTNVPNTPWYGRLQSSWRNETLSNPLLIYSKRIYEGFGYAKWDVYVAEVDLVNATLNEYNVTNTRDIDEFSPSFFGDDQSRNWVVLQLSDGQMFYEAEIVPGCRELWQANYDTVNQANSNSAKTQRARNGNFGLANWSPVPPAEAGEVVTLDQTRLVYLKQVGSYREVFRSDYVGGAFDTSGVQLTPSSLNVNKSNPSIARNGGTISFTMESVPTSISKMNHDGSGLVQFAMHSTQNLDCSSVSPDGRWIVYAKRTSPGVYGIFAKRTTRDATYGESTLVTNIQATAIDAPVFNPDMTRIVYAKQDPGGKFDIYYVPIRVDSTVDDSMIAVGSPVNLTNTPSIHERMPSFSNTGTKIIYCSNKELGIEDYEIFTMDINGSGIEKVVSGPGHRWPVYSPVSDVVAGTDVIGYVENDQIMYATLSRVAPVGTPSGQNPVTNVVGTGINVPSGYERFSWGRNRAKGTIFASRTLGATTAAGQPITYQITVDVDEASVPNSYALNETFSASFNDIHATVDGVKADTTLYYDYPSTGVQTLKLLFMSGQNGGVKDHIVKITLKTPSITGSQAFIGNVSYTIDGVPRSDITTGNGSTMIQNPYIPVDVYDSSNLVASDGIIQDFDLLYAIDAWARDAQLTGYGIVWPQNINNWDKILIGAAGNPGIIPIWANSTFKGGYVYDVTNPGSVYEMFWKPGVFQQ